MNDTSYSEEDLKKSRWLLAHYDDLRRAVFGVGFGIDALIGLILLVAAAFFAFDFYANKGLAESIRASFVHAPPAPIVSDLTLQRFGALASTDGFSDAYAFVANANSDWWAEGQVIFAAGGREYRVPFAAFPDREQLVIRRGMPRAEGVSPRIENVSWRRVTRTDRERLEALAQVRVHSDSLLDLSAHGVPYPRAEFVVTNDSPFSYRDAAAAILVSNGAQTIAAYQVPLPDLRAYESRSVQVQWEHSFPSSGMTLEVMPIIHALKESVYMR